MDFGNRSTFWDMKEVDLHEFKDVILGNCLMSLKLLKSSQPGESHPVMVQDIIT